MKYDLYKSARACMIMLLVGCLSAVAQAQQITTFILIRHAEKVRDGSTDPLLTPDGSARALRLSALLAKASVDVVYTTPTRRTRSTVEPFAKSRGLTVQEYQPHQESAIDDMLRRHAGKIILVCGHSDTTPEIANWLTGTRQYEEFDDADFGNLMIVSVVAKGSATVTWLRY